MESGKKASGRRTGSRGLIATMLLGLGLVGPLSVLATTDGAAAPMQTVKPDDVRSGSLLMRAETPLQTPGAYRLAPRLSTDAGIVVTGTIARITLTQRFRNDSVDWVEGLYVFPLPDEAAVDHLVMRVGDIEIVGEIRERGQAKREYDNARSAGRRVALVTQERPNLFTTNFANLGPGETVDVTIEYQQPVSLNDAVYSLRLPLTMTPRYIPGSPSTDNADRKGSGWSTDTTAVPDASRITPPAIAAANTLSGDQRLTLRATIDAGMPLGAVDSRYHRINVTPDSGDGLTRVTLAEGTVPLDHDLELNWQPASSARPVADVFRHRRDGDDYLMVTIHPPGAAQRGPTALSARELVLVIDTSGSMKGNSLAQAKASATLAVQRLKPSDRFNIVQFNTATGTLFDQAQPASPANVEEARRFIQRLRAQGGTEMAPALAAALAGRPPGGMLRQVIFVTDGSVGNEAQLFDFIEQNLRGARLFTVGIGSAPNGWFMRKAAEAGRGTYTTISAHREVAERMTALFVKLEQPILADIRIGWPGGAEVYPAIVPDLYAGEPIVVRGRVPGGLRDDSLLAVEGLLGGSSWNQYVPLDPSMPDYPGVGVLWARAKIESLADEQRRGADAGLIRKAIVDVALSHHLVSKFTSLIAVDNTPVRVREAILERRQVASLVPHGQRNAATFGMPATATDAPFKRLTGVLSLFVGLVLLWHVHLINRRRDCVRVRRS